MGQSARIILVGFVPVGGEKPMCLKGLHTNDVQPHFGEAAVKPAAHVACFKADLQSFPVLDAISEPTPNVFRTGQAFPFAEFLAKRIDYANRRGLLGNVEAHIIVK